ncbi:hypothetical protein EAG_01779 [Camponotus floridanus]|uniref:Uncharacterized protein n=1 Tax=Camponotus floridanus TaxID=104421 RepID=E2AGJ2_CAMFO|nr:hypothetical protein EAG_01779 [Camponotus floridanus]
MNERRSEGVHPLGEPRRRHYVVYLAFNLINEGRSNNEIKIALLSDFDLEIVLILYPTDTRKENVLGEIAQLNDSNNFAVRLIELVIPPSFDACKSLDDEARREAEDGLVNLITRSYRKSVSRGIVGRDGAPQTQWSKWFSPPFLSFTEVSYRSSRIDKRRGVWDVVVATDAGTKFNQNQRDKAGGSGLCKTTHVRLMVLPRLMNRSGAPRISVFGSVNYAHRGYKKHNGADGIREERKKREEKEEEEEKSRSLPFNAKRQLHGQTGKAFPEILSPLSLRQVVSVECESDRQKFIYNAEKCQAGASIFISVFIARIRSQPIGQTINLIYVINSLLCIEPSIVVFMKTVSCITNYGIRVGRHLFVAKWVTVVYPTGSKLIPRSAEEYDTLYTEKNVYCIQYVIGICLQTPQLCEDSNTLGSIETDPHLRSIE